MRKRASRWGAFFAIVVASIGPLWAATPGCQVRRYDETVGVRQVHDGDTVWLADGRRLRIIGLDTPELGRDGLPAQPYAKMARKVLRSLLRPDARLRLRYDVERRDRYGRLLAHAYLMDGRDVAAVLLRRGLATVLVVPPNLVQVPCYSTAETVARDAGQGIWSLPAYRSVPVARLGRRDTGFHLLTGRVRRVVRRGQGWWLIMAGIVVIHIRDADLANFTHFDPRTLVGREVAARGWLHYHSRWYGRGRTPPGLAAERRLGRHGVLSLRVRHPSALFPLD